MITGRYLFSLRRLPRLGTNSTTSLGSTFQILVTLAINKLFLSHFLTSIQSFMSRDWCLEAWVTCA